jgi:hypothetical protein
MPTPRLHRATRMAAALLAAALVTAAYAWGTRPAAAQEAPASDRPLFEGTHFGIGDSFGADSQVVFLAPSVGPVLLGVGLRLVYDGNLATNQTNANLVLVGAYMIHNRFPFAMGPEVNYVTQLAPSAFDTNELRVGWALWYAPWNIPAVIGTAVFADIQLASDRSAIVATLTPAVRVVFGFR